MTNNPAKDSRAAASVPAQDGRVGVLRKVWRWLTGYSLSADEVIRMTLLYTEIL